MGARTYLNCAPSQKPARRAFFKTSDGGPNAASLGGRELGARERGVSRFFSRGRSRRRGAPLELDAPSCAEGRSSPRIGRLLGPKSCLVRPSHAGCDELVATPPPWQPAHRESDHRGSPFRRSRAVLLTCTPFTLPFSNSLTFCSSSTRKRKRVCHVSTCRIEWWDEPFTITRLIRCPETFGRGFPRV